MFLKIKNNLVLNESESTQSPSAEKTAQSQSIVGAGALDAVKWKAPEGSYLAPRVINMNWLSAHPMMHWIVKCAPANVLWRSLHEHGLEDSAEVVAAIEGEQLVRVLHFELWKDSAQESTLEINIENFFRWLRIWLAESPELAADRFFSMEEETMCLVLTSMVDIYPEGISEPPAHVEEHLLVETPDKRFKLVLKINDDENYELFDMFVKAIYLKDVAFAGRVFSYAAMLVEAESKGSGIKWREGRLADAGFVSAQEAAETLRPKSMQTLRKLVKDTAEQERKRREVREKYPHLFEGEAENNNPELLEEVRLSLIKMEPEQAFHDIEKALGAGETRQIYGVSEERSVVPEHVMEDEEVVEEGAKAIIGQALKAIYSSPAKISGEDIEKSLLVEKVFAHYAQENSEKETFLKERVARIANLFASGFSTQPHASESLHKAVGVTRGCLNLGLELVLSQPEEYDMEEKALDLKQTSLENQITAAIAALDKFGPEVFFHIGWGKLVDESIYFAGTVSSIATKKDKSYPWLKFSQKISVDEGSDIETTLQKLIRGGRYIEISRWLNGIEGHIDPSLMTVFKALLRKVPQFPELISGVEGNDAVRPVETLADLNQLHRFIDHLEDALPNHVRS